MTKEQLRNEFVKETRITVIDEGDYTDWLEEKLIWHRLDRRRLESGMNNAVSAFLTSEHRVKELEAELKQIYERPNINHP